MDDPATVNGDNFIGSGTGAPPAAAASPAAGPMAAVPAAGGDQAPPPATEAPYTRSSPTADPGQPADAKSADAKGANGGVTDTTTVKGQSFGNRMLHGILSALGGSEDRMYTRDPETGKLVVTAVKSGPGTQWKRIIAGALTGAAAGASVRPGPGNLGRAAGAGFSAGNQMVQQAEDRKRETANEDFEAGQKVQIHKAQQALLTQQLATSAWEMQRSKMSFSMDMAKDINSFQSLIASDPTHKDLGVFPTFGDFMEKNGGKETGQGLTDGVLQAFPEIDKNNNVTGVHGYRVTPGWGSKRNADAVQIDLGGPVNGKWVANYQSIPANAYTNDEILMKQKAVADKKAAWEKEVFQQGEENKRTHEKAQAELGAAELHKEGQVESAKIGGSSRVEVAKLRGGLTSTTRTMKETAPSVVGLVDKVTGLLDKNKEKLGPVSGRFSELMAGKIGADDPDFTAIRTNAMLLKTLLMRMHTGARGGQYIMKHFDSLMDTGAQSEGNLRSSLAEIKEYAQRVGKLGEGKETEMPAGAGIVTFKDSQGGMWKIPYDRLEQAKQQDPKLQIIDEK